MRKAGADMDDLFQSTLSVRRATRDIDQHHRGSHGFQSTLSVRRATRHRHQSRAGSSISIHALRKESDMICWGYWVLCRIFQSTLSVRRATIGTWREEDRVDISIHALRKESDGVTRYAEHMEL